MSNWIIVGFFILIIIMLAVGFNSTTAKVGLAATVIEAVSKSVNPNPSNGDVQHGVQNGGSRFFKNKLFSYMNSTSIFLLFLAIFVMSVLFISNKPESFISFNESSSSLNQVVIPQYANTPVYKLYDSVYFDTQNGNIMELFGTTYDNINVDTAGSSLTKIILMNRIPTKTPNSPSYQATSKVIDLSNNGTNLLNSSITGAGIASPNFNQYQYWLYPNSIDATTLSTVYGLNPNYQIVYIPWGNDTIVHVFDTIAYVNVATYYFRQNMDPIHSISSCPSVFMNMIQNKTTSRPSTAINSYTTLNGYENNKQLYQISDNVYFDTSNRYLVIHSSQGMTVYDGTVDSNGPVKVHTNAQTVTGTPSTLQPVEFKVLYMLDTDGGNIVLYMPTSTNKTMVAVLTSDPVNNKLLSVISIALFNPNSSNGVDGNPNVMFSGSSATSVPPPPPPSSNPVFVADASNITQFATVASSILQTLLSSNATNYYTQQYNPNIQSYSEDYILKTQIVPPVCPACPSCTGATCNTCNHVHGTAMLDASFNHNATRRDKNGRLIRGAERVGGDILGGAERIGGDILGGAERIGGKLERGAQWFGNGLESALTMHPTNVANNGEVRINNGVRNDVDNNIPVQKIEQQTVQQSGSDNYSYYGALPSKGPSNYMPILADFSKFGR